MLVWLTLPFYDFCGFRSVAVNSVYKLQFFYIYSVNILDRYTNNSISRSRRIVLISVTLSQKRRYGTSHSLTAVT